MPCRRRLVAQKHSHQTHRLGVAPSHAPTMHNDLVSFSHTQLLIPSIQPTTQPAQPSTVRFLVRSSILREVSQSAVQALHKLPKASTRLSRLSTTFRRVPIRSAPGHTFACGERGSDLVRSVGRSSCRLSQGMVSSPRSPIQSS